jgi:hypothetical protein
MFRVNSPRIIQPLQFLPKQKYHRKKGSPMWGAGEKTHLAFALACHSLNPGG